MTRYDFYYETEIADRLIVALDNKWGVINNKGEVIIPVEYAYVEKLYDLFIVFYELYDGFAGLREKKYGAFDLDGNVVLEVKYKILDSIKKDVYKVIDYYTNKYGIYVLGKGFLFHCEYDSIYIDAYDNILAQKDELYGLYTLDGTEIFPLEYEGIEPSREYIIITQNGKKGLVKYNKEKILDTEYDRIFLHTDYIQVEKDKKIGIVSLDGKQVLIPCEYGRIWYCSGYAVYSKQSRGKFGLMTHRGKILCEPIYGRIVPINKQFMYAIKDGFEGVLDKNGHEVIPVIYDWVISVDPIKGIFTAKKDNKASLITIDGEKIFESLYNEVCSGHDNQFVIVKANGKSGVYDYINKEEIISPIYDDIFYRSNGLFEVRVNEKVGLIDGKGDILLLPIYDGLNEVYTDSATVTLWDYQGIAYFKTKEGEETL